MMMQKLKDLLSRFFGSDKSQDSGTDDVEFKFVERRIDENYTQVATKITTGKYAGLVFSVGPVSFSEVHATDELGGVLTDEKGDPIVTRINMDYKFVVEFKPEGMSVSDDLDSIVGDIILKTLEKEADSQES